MTLKTGLTVTVLPEMVTDWLASRSTNSEVEVLLTVTFGEKLNLYEVLARVGETVTTWALVLPEGGTM